MKLNITLWVALLFSWALPMSGEQVVRLSLEDCLELARGHNLSVRSAQSAVGEARILESSYLDLPQTSVTLVQATTDGGGPDNGLKFAQDFDFPTVYIAKRNYLKAETELSRKQAEMTHQDVIQDVYALYYSLVYQSELRNILLAQDSLYAEFCRLSQVRFEKGETGRLEVLSARRLYNENRLALDRNSSDYSSLRLRLQNVLNVEIPVEPVEQPLLALDGGFAQDSLSFGATPAGMLADRRLEVARRNRQLTRQGFMPSFTVGATAQLVIKGFNPYNVDRPKFENGNFMGIEVGVKVPLFFGSQKAKVKASDKAFETEQLRMEEERNAQSTEFRILCDDLSATMRRLQYFTSSGLPDAREMARLAQVSYQYGQIDYPELIRNLEAFYSVKKAYTDALQDYNQTVIKLKYIKGEL